MSKRDKQGKFVQRSLSQQAWIQFRSNRLAICGLVVIALLILVSITTILIDLTDGGELYKVLVTKNNLPMKLAKPSAAHPLGCDEFGRDLLFRLLWGTRYSLFAGICTILAAILTGGVFGSIPSSRFRRTPMFSVYPSICLASSGYNSLYSCLFSGYGIQKLSFQGVRVVSHRRGLLEIPLKAKLPIFSNCQVFF